MLPLSGLTGELPVVVCFGLCWRYIANKFEQALIVEPRHPFEGSQFHSFPGLPRAAAVDHLGLVQAVDRLGQCIVVAVALAARRGFPPAPARRSL